MVRPAGDIFVMDYLWNTSAQIAVILYEVDSHGSLRAWAELARRILVSIKLLKSCMLVLALAALLAGVTGCGVQGPTLYGGVGPVPDSVQIAIHLLRPPGESPVVTLTNPSLVQHLYNTVAQLPDLPENAICPADMGPSYTLTFLRGGERLRTVTAGRYGCEVVSIVGVEQERQANQAFWSELDQDISLASPIARPEQLAILHRVQLDQSPETALLTSAATVEDLYQAILQLPPASQTGSCSPEVLHHYLLVFRTSTQAIPAVLDQKCQTITLQGNYQSRGGTFTVGAPFEQLFQRTLAAATFTPAKPDRLTMEIQAGNGAAHETTIADAQLRQQLFTTIFALPAGVAQPNCPSGQDKLAGSGTWYSLEFTEWDLLTLVMVGAYQGSCTEVDLDDGQGTNPGQILQGDREFWNLVHQAAGE
jgi:hypothetical protein